LKTWSNLMCDYAVIRITAYFIATPKQWRRMKLYLRKCFILSLVFPSSSLPPFVSPFLFFNFSVSLCSSFFVFFSPSPFPLCLLSFPCLYALSVFSLLYLFWKK
jgi:hypothetical protein